MCHPTLMATPRYEAIGLEGSMPTMGQAVKLSIFLYKWGYQSNYLIAHLEKVGQRRRRDQLMVAPHHGHWEAGTKVGDPL